jgi:GntR family transcriptional repressor for pyruvate dehydrogenase complex
MDGLSHEKSMLMERVNNTENSKNIFQEVKPTRLSDEIFEQIKSLIFQGKLHPNSKLPTEYELMNIFKVGRSCLREALNQLRAVGLIETRRKDGYFVRSISTEIIGPLKTFIESEVNNLIDFMEVRKLLDVWAVKVAIESGTEDDFNRIKNAIEKTHGFDFHIAIVEATHNLIFCHLMTDMYTLISSISFIKTQYRNNREIYINQHRKIFDAIINKDSSNAEKAVMEHLDKLINDVITQEKK